MKGEDKRRVTVFLNGTRLAGKAIYVPKKWNDFLKIVSKKVFIISIYYIIITTDIMMFNY